MNRPNRRASRPTLEKCEGRLSLSAAGLGPSAFTVWGPYGPAPIVKPRLLSDYAVHPPAHVAGPAVTAPAAAGMFDGGRIVRPAHGLLSTGAMRPPAKPVVADPVAVPQSI